MAEQEKPPSFDDIEARLRAARSRDQDQTGGVPRGRLPARGITLGFRVGVELVVSVLVGSGIGWGLDEWLGTRPWLMVLFLLLGGAAGVMGVYRLVRGVDETIGLGAAERRVNGDPAGGDAAKGDTKDH